MGSRDEWDALRRQADELAAADDWGPRAIAVYEQMIALNGRNEWAYCKLARCHEIASDFDSARRIYLHVKRFSPGSNCAGRGLEQLEKLRRVADAVAMSALRASDIRTLLERRDVKFLFHFTRAENVASILERGLLSQSALLAAGIPAVINDEARIDGHPDAVCMSIGFPNYRMFYVLQKDRSTTWAVVAIDASILWRLDCAFYSTNAAKNAMRFQSPKHRATVSALEELFADPCPSTGVARHSQLPDDYTTDPQAEVLIFEPVPNEYIAGVCFKSDSERSTVYVPPAFENRVIVGDAWFGNRRDYWS